MPIPDEHREFLQKNRLCVVGFARKAGPPSLSPVYYFLDGEDIVISTTASRAKARAVRRNPEVTVCVLAESMPFAYLTVYGRGRVVEEGAADVMMRIGGIMAGSALPETARPAIEERARNEGRVVLRITPQSFFNTQPRAPRTG